MKTLNKCVKFYIKILAVSEKSAKTLGNYFLTHPVQVRSDVVSFQPSDVNVMKV